MSEGIGRDYIQSVDRCLSVITAFTDVKTPMSLIELSKATKLSKPAVRRILLTLQHLGYARSHGTRFGLTPKVLGLGYAYLSSLTLTELAQPRMEALTDQIRESTSLVALDGPDVIYINRVHRHRISSVTLAVGTRLPAHATSSGHVLLADLGPEAFGDYLANASLTALTEYTLTTPKMLTDRLELVRTRGWDAVDQELEIGRRSAAAPIRDAGGAVIAALSFSCGTRERSFEQMIDELLPALLRTAEQITIALGGDVYSTSKRAKPTPA